MDSFKGGNRGVCYLSWSRGTLRFMPKVVPKASVTRVDAPDGKSSMFVSRAGGDDENPAQSGLDAAADLAVEMARARLERAGLGNVPGTEQHLQRLRTEHRAWLEHETRSSGIAPRIIRLFEAPTKKDAVRVAHQLAITKSQWATLLLNAREYGYRVNRKVREFLPDNHDALSQEMSEALGEIAGPGPAGPRLARAMRRANALHDQTRVVNAFMFSKGAKWHCFYFAFGDLLGDHHGTPHVHYLSHRWIAPGLSKETVWASFEKRSLSLPSEHIRYVDESASPRVPGQRFFGDGQNVHVLRVDNGMAVREHNQPSTAKEGLDEDPADRES